DGVRATLNTSAGKSETITCRYLVGCDGAHSTVRHALGLSFEGGAFPVEFLLADVELTWQFAHAEACIFFELREETMENLLVCIPYRDRINPARPRYRLSTMAQPVSAVNWENPTPAPKEAPEPSLDRVQELVRYFVPVSATVSELRWSSVFRI